MAAAKPVTKLYGWAISPFVSRALLCLEEAGVDYDHVTMSRSAGDHRRPDHLARNPFGQVPVLEDGDLTLFVSRAIARHVFRKHKPELLGSGDLERAAMVDVWTEVEAHQFQPAAGAIVVECVFAPLLGRARDQRRVDENVGKLRAVLEVFEARLAGKHRYLAGGDDVSLADLSHFRFDQTFHDNKNCRLFKLPQEASSSSSRARLRRNFLAAAAEHKSSGAEDLLALITTSTGANKDMAKGEDTATVPKVYGVAASPFVATVLVCLEEAGAAYELVPLDMAAREQRAPHHLARNPLGKIPAFEDGDLTLFESRAIARHVLRKHRPDLLGGGDPARSATLDAWTEAEAHQFHPPASHILRQCVILPMIGGGRDQRVVDENVSRLRAVLDVYDARLAKHRYLAGGEEASLADLAHVGVMLMLMGTEFGRVVEERGNVKAWWDRIAARPAVRKVAALVDAEVAVLSTQSSG
ncbi:hypothetical protein PR202_ga11263 [Eleusine coracana subsp. coracana]|uniref:glutathione transferase n=1 Tax=Eleusine coracana subsp. coracana TaxID=191504 RepID=A0AAV5C8K3_ELECO|nr:hypothetical protein PR202_ga11263 [Eleusine coracana subsp. coracana]